MAEHDGGERCPHCGAGWLIGDGRVRRCLSCDKTTLRPRPGTVTLVDTRSTGGRHVTLVPPAGPELAAVKTRPVERRRPTRAPRRMSTPPPDTRTPVVHDVKPMSRSTVGCAVCGQRSFHWAGCYSTSAGA